VFILVKTLILPKFVSDANVYSTELGFEFKGHKNLVATRQNLGFGSGWGRAQEGV